MRKPKSGPGEPGPYKVEERTKEHRLKPVLLEAVRLGRRTLQMKQAVGADYE